MISKELQTFLEDTGESFDKKIIIADNAYKCPELAVGYKEVFLLKWIIKHSNEDYKECWKCINNWLRSTQFNKLNKNDINREDFINIIELIQEKLLLMDMVEMSTKRLILDSILLLIDNVTFRHYFKYNVDIYCKFISSLLHNIDCIEYLKGFLNLDLFDKHILAHEKFHKNFLINVLPSFIECLKKFECVEVFDYISKYVQKCLFYRNHKTFKIFIDHFFEDLKLEKKIIPKYLIKYMLNTYKTNQDAMLIYKIIFHAFCAAYYQDFELIYKFLILLVHITGFNLKDKLILAKTTKLDLPKSELSLIKSQEIILVLLEVLSENKNDLNIKINDVTFTEFIRNILKQLLYFNTPSTTSYKIFLKSIAIDPLSIEPITDDIIIYTMISDKHKHSEYYEIFNINIFDIYSKLRRIEHFISKMVHTLNNYFNGQRKILEEVYKFNGEIDSEEVIMEGENIKTDHIFTEKILQQFSRCICNLASWQIINVFKTLLHQLHQILNDIDKNDHMENFMEIMSVLISTFLCSIRITEHSVGTTVIEKLLKELEELRNILQQFGMILLNREHNQKLMRSFLNISYNWAEVYMSLEYYSINNEVELNKSIDNNFAACNITYLHSYLTVKQWCLISERITNFGEIACKQLLEKLYIQKLRAMLLSEKSVNEDIVQNVIKSITGNIDIMWKNILEDKFVINNLLSKMEPSYALFIAEKVVCDTDTLGAIRNKPHITSSSFLITAVNYVIITKINKLLTRRKDKVTSDSFKKAVSIRISSVFTEDNFLTQEPKEIIESVKSLYSLNQNYEVEWNINEEKVLQFFEILEKFPVIFCSETVQKLCLVYFCALHMDLSSEFKRGNYKKLQIACEKLIIGILQHGKFKIENLFTIEDLCNDIVQNYGQWECIFYIITENVFKDEYSVSIYEPIISNFTEKLLTPVYMRCCIIMVNIANKIKKLKISKNIKNVVEKYKSIICDKILDIVLQNKPMAILIDGYCLSLKHFLFNNEEEKLSKLLTSLNSYVDLALKDTEYPESNFTLLIIVLENKVKMQPTIGDEFFLKMWNVYKEKDWIYSRTDKLPQMAKLIFGQASNEEFMIITTDLLNLTEDSVAKKDYEVFAKNITIWESILSCDLNPTKIKNFQSILEKLLQKSIILLQNSLFYENLYKCIFNLQKTIIQTVHLPLTWPMADMLILSITLLYGNRWGDKSIFSLSITQLEFLLKYRKPLIMDRLPCFSQIYRILLKNLCERSNANLNLEGSAIKEVSDDSHQLEKLTKSLVLNHKDMARIAVYLIADILQHYEQINLHPNVKMHLNNCVYSLLSICDQHAIAFLMRALSSASTELFKDMYESYKRFYRFTGKV
ncbi:uncharacterized protein LOC108916212 [Anoplophora glabripennis]|nr:uncharacterized protein LOC108916212 [Anoplophora glabripennis]